MATNATAISSNGNTATQHRAEALALPHSTTWQIDPAASRVEFAIGKRLMFVRKLTVTGRFTEVQGTISLDDRDPATAQATVTIGAASIDTRLARRDAHLRTADFFDVERHPALIFTSRRVEISDRAAGRYRVTGDLTIRGITREVHLAAQCAAPEKGTRLRITLTGSLQRRDFGLLWSTPVITIADDVALTLDVQAVKHA